MIAVAETMKTAVEHHQAGRLQLAEKLYQLVLRDHPDNPTALHSLALATHQKGNHTKAVELIEKAITANSQIPVFYNTLGLVFEAMEKFEEAIHAYEQALKLDPEYAEAYHNTAIAQKSLLRYDDAVENCQKTISIKLDYAQAYNTIGYCLDMQGKDEEAIKYYRKAIRYKPDYAEAYNHLGTVLSSQHRYEEAIENYKRAIQIDPDYAEAHWNLSPSLLITGQLAEGWREYQWRKNPDLEMVVYPHHYEQPLWDGSAFPGKRLLVHYEQGLGDTINFVRYLPMVKALGGTVIFEVRKPLYRLFRNLAGVDELIEASLENKPTVNFDYHVSLLDLPSIFETTIDTIPDEVPYIHASTEKVEYWRKKLASPYLKVGIVWSGSPHYERNHLRACKLENFASLFAIDGIKLYSLQKGQPVQQIDQLANKTSLTDLGEEFEDFSDTAAAIENLDLVISTDTSVPHLAAAMGKPVWLLLSLASDWRWLKDRDDSPWYPTIKIFRQEKHDQWPDVFEHVNKELRKILSHKKQKINDPVRSTHNQQKVPVIIPAYKNPDQLVKCKQHLDQQSVPVEIFIRDNNKDNVYFTAAINEGIRKYLEEDCKYIVILNQDMYLENNAVEEMVKFMDSHPKCGIGTPLQLSSKTADYVIYAGGIEAFPTGTHLHGQLSNFTKDQALYWGNGACMILRKKMIQEIGLMDKNYVLIGSDSDYCFTARARGWQVWSIVSARGVHEGGITARLGEKEFEILKMKDCIYFGKKWLTGELYKGMAYEGEQFTGPMIDEFMSQFHAVKHQLENSISIS